MPKRKPLKGLIEAVKEAARLPAQLLRAPALAERIEHLGHPNPSVVDIALQLAEAFRPFDQRAIWIDHAIRGILPGHVLVADRRSRLVFLKTIAVAVAIVVYPRKASLRGIKMPLEKRPVAGRTPSRCKVMR